MSEYVETVETSADGLHRVSLVLDLDGDHPGGGFFGTVLAVDYGRWGHHVDELGSGHGGAEDWSDTLGTLLRVLGNDWDVIEDVLRGRANVCDECKALLDGVGHDADGGAVCGWYDEPDDLHEPRYDFTSNPVVGFDRASLRDSELVNVVTLDDLRAWGFDTVDDYRTSTGHDDPSHGNLVEWEAWDGDMYGWVVERRVTWTTENEGFDDRDSWEQVDSCWGYYGHEWAVQAAREALDEVTAA